MLLVEQKEPRYCTDPSSGQLHHCTTLVRALQAVYTTWQQAATILAHSSRWKLFWKAQEISIPDYSHWDHRTTHQKSNSKNYGRLLIWTQQECSRAIYTGYSTEQGTLVVTDKWYGYNELHLLGYGHESWNHSTGQFSATNQIEGLWSSIKRYLRKLYGCVPTKNLESILTEWMARQKTIYKLRLFHISWLSHFFTVCNFVGNVII